MAIVHLEQIIQKHEQKSLEAAADIYLSESMPPNVAVSYMHYMRKLGAQYTQKYGFDHMNKYICGKFDELRVKDGTL